eukprot:3188953-Ditylum_brightwellii.AAC.1
MPWQANFKGGTNRKEKVDEVYPDHVESLFIADVAPEVDFPAFKDSWKEEDARRERGKKRNRRAHRDQ